MRLIDIILARAGSLRGRAPTSRSNDKSVVERYEHLLRTTPIHTIEQVHAEAFAKLTPAQLVKLFEQLSNALKPGGKPTDARPGTLAKAGAEAERHQPGSLATLLRHRSFGTADGPLLETIAGHVIASKIAGLFLWDDFHANASAPRTVPDHAGGAGRAAGGSEDQSPTRPEPNPPEKPLPHIV